MIMGKRVEQVLTDEFCKNVIAPAQGNKLHRCGKTRGLALRVTSAGTKAFVFCYSDPTGRERRIVVGRYKPWTLAAAKKRVEELRRDLDHGIDPAAVRQERRTAPTLSDLWQSYSTSELPKLSAASQRDIRRCWEKKIRPQLGPHTQLCTLKREHIQKLVDHVTSTSGEVAGNRCHSYIRRMLTIAVANEMVGQNVATRHIQRNQEQPRHRYLTREEADRLLSAIDANLHLPGVAAVKVLLLTGARRAEVLGMRWAEIDLETAVWVKPPSNTKQRRIHRVPLSKVAVELLQTLKARGDASPYVFPSSGREGHLTEIKRSWAKLCSLAQIEKCRLHDLRHTFASLIVSGGGTLPMIGAMLGHSQPSTTQRYAHLFDEPLRAAAEQVASAITGQLPSRVI